MGLNIFKERDELKTKLSEADTRYQSLLTEFERYRRHSRDEQEGADRRAMIRAAAAFLPVYDLMLLALDAPGADESYRSGIRMTRDRFIQTLKDCGIIRMECLGKPFDPEFHEAAEQAEAEGSESGTIIAVQRDGFFSETEGVVVRHAMVTVAK